MYHKRLRRSRERPFSAHREIESRDARSCLQGMHRRRVRRCSVRLPLTARCSTTPSRTREHALALRRPVDPEPHTLLSHSGTPDAAILSISRTLRSSSKAMRAMAFSARAALTASACSISALSAAAFMSAASDPGEGMSSSMLPISKSSLPDDETLAMRVLGRSTVAGKIRPDDETDGGRGTKSPSTGRITADG